MITVRSLIENDQVIGPPPPSSSAPALSVVLRADASAPGLLHAAVEGLCRPDGLAETIVILEGTPDMRRDIMALARWCADHGCRVIVGSAPYHLPALRFNQGILCSRAPRILLIDVTEPAPAPNVELIAACSRDASPDSVLVFINPADEHRMVAVPGAHQTPWVDMLFKGYRFPLQNLVFPASAFRAHGLLDPHVLVASHFDQDFLLRICRHLPFSKVVHPEGEPGLRQTRWPDIVQAWFDIDRRALLQPAIILDYALDEVPSAGRTLPRSLEWRAYLEHVLPYVHRHGAYLPDVPGRPAHSVPARTQQILAIKTNYYETLVDVGFRNYDVFAQGRYGFKSTYAYFLQMPAHLERHYDAVLLIRTIDQLTYQLASDCVRDGPPVGYALDDDLIRMYEYEGEFAAFRPGHPAYEHMLRLLRTVDAVLSSSDAIRDSVRPLNPRLVHYEGSLLPEYLPDSRTERSARFRFGYAGGGYRRREMQMLWPAIERLCRELGDQVEFQFWGLEPHDLPTLLPQVSCRPFSTSYYEYLARLRSARFDAMLVPLLSEPAPNRAKAPNKLYETVAAGAVGLFSDVPSYQVVARNDLGLVVDERWEAWYEAMRRVLGMGDAGLAELRERATHFVREFYTTGAMLPVHESGFAALMFHGATRHARDPQGRPVVLFVFPVMTGVGGGEVLLRRRILLARSAGIAPVALLPAVTKATDTLGKFCAEYLAPERIPYDFAWYQPYLLTPPRERIEPHPDEVASILDVLEKRRPALVHSGGFIPAVGAACAKLNLPHVVSHYLVDDDYEWPQGSLGYRHCDLVQSDSIRYAKKWGALFECEWFCSRDSVPEELFELGFARLYGARAAGGDPRPLRMGVVGTLIPRKSQLEVIRAFGLLADAPPDCELSMWGSEETDPEYASACRAEVERLGLRHHVRFHGHHASVSEIYADLDVLISASAAESFPNSIKEGTAAGALVVATLAGGIGELIQDGMNGVVSSSPSPEHIARAIRRAMALGEDARRRIRSSAFSMARREFHPRRALADLLTMYNQALDLHQAAGAEERLGRKQPERVRTTPGTRAAGHEPSSLPARVSMVGTPGRHHRLSGSLQYRVSVDRDGWSGLDVLVATDGQPPSGRLSLRIMSEAGEPLREGVVDLADLEGNGWARFRFGVIRNSGGMRVRVRLEIQGQQGKGKVSIVEDRDRESLLGRLAPRAVSAAGVQIVRGHLHCRLRYT